jgi:hypothetical protein
VLQPALAGRCRYIVKAIIKTVIAKQSRIERSQGEAGFQVIIEERLQTLVGRLRHRRSRQDAPNAQTQPRAQRFHQYAPVKS